MSDFIDTFVQEVLEQMAGVSQEVMVKLASYSEEATEEMADTFLLARRDTFKTMEKVMLTIKVHNKNKSGMPRSCRCFLFTSISIISHIFVL